MRPFPLLLWKKLLPFPGLGSIADRFLMLALVWILAGSCPVFASSATTVTMVVTSGGNAVTSVSQGAAVTLTATVLAGSTPVTTGQVNFCDTTVLSCTDIHLLATAQLTSAGTATFKFRPGAGNHSYKAVFVATTANAGSASAISTLAVTAPAKIPTTTSIAQTGTNGSYALTAMVGGNGNAAPTGIVSFLDTTNSNAVVATAPLGVGTGFGFVNASSLALSQAGAVGTGDFNGDGIPDIVVTNPAQSGPAAQVTVFLGNGDGTFETVAGNPATGGDPYAIAVGDFNRDGFEDMAVINAASNNVTILLGIGNGTFTAAATSPGTGNDPVAIAADDFNNDGILDLAVANAQSETVTILLGNGDGTFTPAANSPATGFYPSSIVSGDWNGDGNRDLAVANNVDNTVTVLIGDGRGNFTAAASPAAGMQPASIVTGDFNGDGMPDLALADSGTTGDPGSVTILLGNGNGTFTPAAASLVTGVQPDFMVIGDFNGDGIADLATANETPDTVTVLLGKGDGTFLSTTTIPGSNFYAGTLAVADLDGDGLSDLVVGNLGTGGTYPAIDPVMLGFAETATATATGITVDNGSHLVQASYPGDANYNSSVSVTTNLVGPTAATTLTLSVGPSGTAAPGQQVTLTATLSPSTVQGHSTDGDTITFYNGSSVFGTGVLSGGVATLTLTPLPTTYSMSAGFSGDAYFAGSTSNTVALVVGPATSTTLTLFASPSGGVVSGQSVTLTARLSPYTVQGHSTDGETITFYNGSSILGTGTLASGTATLVVTPTSSTPYNVTAGYAGDIYLYGSVSGDQSFYVSPPLATTLALSVSPNPITYGGSVTMTATLSPYTDQGVTANGQVTFNYSNTTGYSAAVQANLTNGVATTTGGVYGLPAGSYQVQATYPGNAAFEAPAPATVTLTVNKAAPSVMLTSSANPAMVGTMVTFTAAVPVFPTPSEEPEIVIFYDGTTQLGMSQIGLGGGGTTFSTSTLAVGTHSIAAVYSGDNNNLPSTSAALSQVITSAVATPTIALTSSANPASVSSPVTFSASLTSSARVPTGTVSFYDGTTQIGSGMLSMGATSYTTSSLATGSHAITAEYSGDANNSPITSSVLTETIESFMLSAPGGGSVPAQTASPGGQANYALAIGPPSGTTFPATVTFSVTGLPTGAAATFSPTTLPANSGATNVTMTVTLPSQSAAARPSSKPFTGGWTPMALGLILLPFAGRLRKGARRWKGIVCWIVLIVAGAALTAGLTACGSGGSNGGGSSPSPQTYTLTITATSGSLSQSTTTSLTVQ